MSLALAFVCSSGLRLPAIFHLGLRFNIVAFEHDFAGWLLDADADGLFARVGRARVADDVVLEDEVLRFAAHADASRVGFRAVVFDDVVLKTIPVAGHAFALVTEEDAVLMIGADLVFAQQIIGVLVADGIAEAPIVLQNVLLEQPVLHAPAEEESVLAVAPRGAVANDGALRAAAGMEAQPGVVLAHAVLHEHVVGLLEADAVAVIVPHRAIFDDGAKAAIEKDAATATPVERDVLALVAVDDEVFNASVFEVVATRGDW